MFIKDNTTPKDNPCIKNGYMAAPALTISVDHKVFKQSKEERGAAITAKATHRADLQRAYGANWKKFLNIPEKTLGNVMRMSF